MNTSISRLARVDWLIIFVFLALSLAIGIVLSRRGRRSVREYFTSGGSMPWWVLGTSMVATSFAADTPITLAGWVVTKGVAQNWFWWCQVPVTMLGVFFIARLWFRARLVTDTEFVHLRYSGKPASVLRGFRALYLGLVYGCLIIGWVNLAMTKIVRLILPDLPRVHVVDEALLWTYLHTPLSNDLDGALRAAMARKAVDPLRLYYDDWGLQRQPGREAAIADVALVLRRVDALERAAAVGPGPSGRAERSAAEERLQTALGALDVEALLERLGLAGRLETLAAQGAAHGDVTVPTLPARQALLLLRDVIEAVSGVNRLKVVLMLFAIVMIYTVMSGLTGVMVTDFIQFWIAMLGSIVVATYAVGQLGGLDAVMARMVEIYSAEKARGMVSLIPPTHAGDLDLMPWSYFLVFIFFSWYVSGLTDGGSYFAQRMLSARDERHATLGFLWYAVAHYCLRMWPWIVTGIAAAVMFPYTRDPVTHEYPGGAIAENGYIKVMLAVLPTGWLGLVIASFFAAFMSTISTHLNLGASYLLNDFYRPFIRPQASEKHYVFVSQVATVLVALVGVVVSLFFVTISDAWFLIGTLSAGTGLVYLLRWFWWRVNAWTEITCQVSLLALVVAVSVFDETLGGLLPPYPLNLLYLVPYSVGLALIVTLLTRPEDQAKLMAFVKQVQPGGPGWRGIEAKIRAAEPGFRCRSPLNSANGKRWLAATVAIYCILFGVGKLILGDVATPSPWIPGRWLGGILILAGVVLGHGVARTFSSRRWEQT